MLKPLLVALALLGTLGCNNYGATTTAPSSTSTGTARGGVTPTPTPLPVAADRIEYRVTGTAATVLVRWSTSTDGLSQVTTSLPWTQAVSTTSPSLFLSLEALPTTASYTTLYPFLSAQIFVNGVLFREDTSTSYTAPVTVSGTWRR